MDQAPRLRFAWKPFLVQSQIVGMLVLAQSQLNMWTSELPSPATADRLILLFLLFAGLNLAVMLAGDIVARQFGWWRRGHYLALGAVAATISHAVALAPDAYVEAARDGALFGILLTPVLIGMASAYLLYRSLGYDTEGDDPEALRAAAASEGTRQTGQAVHDTGTAAYYEGPLQVRSSAMAALIAAFAGAALFVVISLISMTDGVLPAGAVPPVLRANPILGTLYGIIGLAIPFYVFVRRSHAFLQARGKDAVKSYVLAGVFVPLGFALAFTALMGPFGVLMVLPWVLPSIAAMIVYHRLAGFEPLALPADIEVSDPRTMLPADHIRRRVRRVVRTD